MRQAHRDDDWPEVTVRGFLGSVVAAVLIVLFAWVGSVAYLIAVP